MTKLYTANDIVVDNTKINETTSLVSLYSAIDNRISTKDILDSLDKDDILEYAEKYCTKLARHLNGE